MQCGVPEGGLVPKSLYMNRDDEDEKEKDRSPEESPFGTDSLYHTAYVMKDWPHEVIVSQMFTAFNLVLESIQSLCELYLPPVVRNDSKRRISHFCDLEL